MEKTRILVVEDEILVARDLQSKLQRTGYDVPEIVDTGAGAIDMASALQPGLVLMDIRIKGNIDGVEAAERIRETHRIPVVYLTAYADDATVARAKLTTPFGYILKPFQLKELKTTIEIALYRHEMESALHDAHAKLARQVAELDARDRLVHFQMSGPTMAQAWSQILVVFDEVFPAQLSMVYWPDDNNAVLEPVAEFENDTETGPDDGTKAALSVDDETLVAQVFRQAQPQRDEAGDEVAVPIVYRDTVMGVIWTRNATKDAVIDDDVVNSLWRLAQQAALLLRMARVGEDLSSGNLGVSELIALASGEIDGQEEE